MISPLFVLLRLSPRAEAPKTVGESGRKEPSLVQARVQRESHSGLRRAWAEARADGLQTRVFYSTSLLTAIRLHKPPGKPGVAAFFPRRNSQPAARFA